MKLRCSSADRLFEHPLHGRAVRIEASVKSATGCVLIHSDDVSHLILSSLFEHHSVQDERSLDRINGH